MKFRLEFMSIVSTDRAQAKRKFLDDVIDKPDGIFLRMLWIDLQGPDTGCIMHCGAFGNASACGPVCL